MWFKLVQFSFTYLPVYRVIPIVQVTFLLCNFIDYYALVITMLQAPWDLDTLIIAECPLTVRPATSLPS